MGAHTGVWAGSIAPDAGTVTVGIAGSASGAMGGSVYETVNLIFQ